MSSYCGRALSSGFRTITRRWIKGSSIVALSGLGQNVSADVAWAYDGADLGAHNATTINAEKVLKVKGEIPRASAAFYRHGFDWIVLVNGFAVGYPHVQG